MTDFEIVSEYMERKYSGKTYAMRQGNNCIWVSIGMVDMYFTIKNDKIVDIQVD